MAQGFLGFVIFSNDPLSISLGPPTSVRMPLRDSAGTVDSFSWMGRYAPPYVRAQKRPRGVEGCRGALAPFPGGSARAGGAMPISIRPNPEVH
jgi:hypothetical protein